MCFGPGRIHHNYVTKLAAQAVKKSEHTIVLQLRPRFELVSGNITIVVVSWPTVMHQ
jgi:hypothetical protein